MSNNKQSSVEWFAQQLYETLKIKGDGYVIDSLLDLAKEMEIAGREMSYADGYKEGYKRALEVMEWYIKNHISGMPQDHIGDINKKVDE
jgi:hypothetical protein